MTTEINTQIMPGRKILVLGGAGYIGKALCDKLLLRGTNVTVVSRNPVATLFPHGFVTTDDRGLINWMGHPKNVTFTTGGGPPETVFHVQSRNILARPHIPGFEAQKIIINAAGVSNVRKSFRDYVRDILLTGMLMAMKNDDQRIILLSSTEVYGSQPLKNTGFREDDDLEKLDIPVNNDQLERIVAKANELTRILKEKKCTSDSAAEQLGSYLESFDFPIRWHYGISRRIMEGVALKAKNSSIARLSNVFGIPMQPDKVMSVFMEKALQGKEITINGGEQTRTFIHINDVVDAIRLMIETDARGVFNISDPQNNISIRALARKIVEKMGSSSKINIFDAEEHENLPENPIIDTAKAYKELGFKAEISLDSFLLSLKQIIDIALHKQV